MCMPWHLLPPLTPPSTYHLGRQPILYKPEFKASTQIAGAQLFHHTRLPIHQSAFRLSHYPESLSDQRTRRATPFGSLTDDKVTYPIDYQAGAAASFFEALARKRKSGRGGQGASRRLLRTSRIGPWLTAVIYLSASYCAWSAHLSSCTTHSRNSSSW